MDAAALPLQTEFIEAWAELKAVATPWAATTPRGMSWTAPSPEQDSQVRSVMLYLSCCLAEVEQLRANYVAQATECLDAPSPIPQALQDLSGWIAPGRRVGRDLPLVMALNSAEGASDRDAVMEELAVLVASTEKHELQLAGTSQGRSLQGKFSTILRWLYNLWKTLKHSGALSGALTSGQNVLEKLMSLCDEKSLGHGVLAIVRQIIEWLQVLAAATKSAVGQAQ